jgi:hypothetical protein
LNLEIPVEISMIEISDQSDTKLVGVNALESQNPNASEQPSELSEY